MFKCPIFVHEHKALVLTLSSYEVLFIININLSQFTKVKRVWVIKYYF
jgi:hypothetical protein